jgi:hypothetical protein
VEPCQDARGRKVAPSISPNLMGRNSGPSLDCLSEVSLLLDHPGVVGLGPWLFFATCLALYFP